MDNQNLYDMLAEMLIELKQHTDELKGINATLGKHSDKLDNLNASVSKNNMQNVQNSVSIMKLNDYISSITDHEERLKKLEEIFRKSA